MDPRLPKLKSAAIRDSRLEDRLISFGADAFANETEDEPAAASVLVGSSDDDACTKLFVPVCVDNPGREIFSNDLSFSEFANFENLLLKLFKELLIKNYLSEKDVW